MSVPQTYVPFSASQEGEYGQRYHAPILQDLRRDVDSEIQAGIICYIWFIHKEPFYR